MSSSYFSLVPNLKYNVKPITYPFSESDFVVTKNFFKKFRINQQIFDNTFFFDKVIIPDTYQRLEQVAEDRYGRADFDWVIALTNNLINPQFDFPLTPAQLRNHVEKNYDDPYNTVRHYEIISNTEQEEAYGRVLYDEGTHVDETFYNKNHKYLLDDNEEVASGRDLAFPVTEYQFEQQINDNRRNLYALKPELVELFIDDIRKQTRYKKSSAFLDGKLKQSGK